MQQIWVQSLGLEDPPGEGNGNPLQYSCLGNPMDRGAWRATIHGVARAGDNLDTKPPPPPFLMCLENGSNDTHQTVNSG